MQSETKLVLSICGGGFRNVMTAVLLDQIQNQLGKPLCEVFDLICGTSGGGILALMAGSGYAGSYTDFFSESNLKAMMPRSILDRVMGRVQFDPVYDGRGKSKLLQKHMGSLRMGDLKCPTFVPTLNISRNETEILSSYDAKTRDLLAWQVGDATSAAAPIFPPVQIGTDNYLDGGFSAHDPIAEAFTEARDLFGDGPALRFLSLGTGELDPDPHWKTEEVKEWGAIQWFAHGFLDVLLYSGNNRHHHRVKKLVSTHPSYRLLALNAKIPNFQLDDASKKNVTFLKRKAMQLYEENAADLDTFFRPGSSKRWCGMT